MDDPYTKIRRKIKNNKKNMYKFIIHIFNINTNFRNNTINTISNIKW